MTFADRADRYAHEIASGKKVACKWVRLACKRYLRDREDSRWHFDAEWVQTVCEFMELLPHSQGEWAERGELLVLEDWQVFIVANIFGFINPETGARRFRRAYLEIPRKNGKSLLAAAIALVMFLIDGEAGPVVFTGATKKKQAKMVFTPARQIMLREPELRDAFGVEVNVESLVLPDGGRFEPLVGRPGDGESVSCAIVDEYHEHRTDELREAMVTGTKARKQPLTLIITTAGFSLTSPCAQMNADMRQVLEGVISDEQTFTCIWTIDEGDDWKTEEALRKANPNYGVSVDADQLRADLAEAITRPAKQTAYKTKHLNIWVRAGSPFFNLEAWENCRGELRLEDMRGRRCIIGADLASKRDLAALVLMFELDDGKFGIIPRFYLPQERIDEETRLPYQQWVKDGWLTATTGNITDYEQIEREILEMRDAFDLVELPIDPHDATMLTTRLTEEGVHVVEFQQSTRLLSEPMQQLDADIIAGNLIHDGNPVMTWCIANTVARHFGNKKVRPYKEREDAKIDGTVAAIMARARWMVLQEEPESRYEDEALEHQW